MQGQPPKHRTSGRESSKGETRGTGVSAKWKQGGGQGLSGPSPARDAGPAHSQAALVWLRPGCLLPGPMTGWPSKVQSRAWNPEPSGLGTRAPVGLQQLQGFVLLGWWQGLGPGPRSPWLGIQRAGRTPRHRSLGLLCASVDSSSCFSRGSQGPTAPTGQMPASPLAGWPSTLGRAIAQPSLDSDGEGAMARPLKPALV